MLEYFKLEQELFCNEVEKILSTDKISHAFLIETNGYNKSEQLVLAFVKSIFKKYVNDENEFLNISTLIDNNSFDDFIIVDKDGAFIKKEQIINIKDEFMTTSISNRPRVYLIKNADRLNKYAANSLLKFLEEPDGDVIAILETVNRYRVLETLRSRCQVYSFINNKKSIDLTNIDLITAIIENLEKYREKSIAYLPSILDNDLRDKEFWIDAFNTMINIYENAIRKIENINCSNYGDVINIILRNNDLQNIVNKIDVLFTTLQNLDYNLNISMMLDKFIIEFTGGDSNEKNSRS